MSGAVRALRRALGAGLERTFAGRLALGWLATAYIAVRRRRWCRVSRSGEHWVFRWSTGTITDPVLTSRPPEDWAAEVRDIALHRYVPAPGDVVIDVGAGVGHETRVLAPLVGPAGRVVAVEANPRVHASLVDMVERGALTNVTCVLAAAAAGHGEVTVGDGRDHLSNAVRAGGVGALVPAVPIDDLAADLGLDEIAFVKMNIEGAELDALRGMRAVLARTREVCISCHDFLADADADADAGGGEELRTKAAVRGILVDAGFVLEERDDPRPWVRDYLYGARA